MIFQGCHEHRLTELEANYRANVLSGHVLYSTSLRNAARSPKCKVSDDLLMAVEVKGWLNKGGGCREACETSYNPQS